jgi:large subunit ribosomal protein L22
MGARKRLAAEARKERNSELCIARLVDNNTSPRKTRLMADLVRGKDIEYALNVLKYSKKESSGKIRKLILSAISNWQVKNESARVEDSELYIKEIFVDGGTMLKRLRTAPKGMGYRIRKRSNHITVILGSKTAEAEIDEVQETEGVEEIQTARKVADKAIPEVAEKAVEEETVSEEIQQEPEEEIEENENQTKEE